MNVFNKKKPEKVQSISINPVDEIPEMEEQKAQEIKKIIDEIPERKDIAEEDLAQPVQQEALKDFVIVTEAALNPDGSYRYVIVTDKQLYLGLQEED